MENKEVIPESILDRFMEDVDKAPERIKTEFEKGGNDWIACLASQITVLNSEVFIIGEDKILDEDKFNKLDSHMKMLLEYLKELREKYPGTTNNLEKDLPPEEVRKKILESLRILKEID